MSASPRFETLPNGFDLKVSRETYVTHCAVLPNNGDPVLVGLFKHRYAKPDTPYEAPSMEYMRAQIARDPQIVRDNVLHRLPHDDEEHHALLRALATPAQNQAA